MNKKNRTKFKNKLNPQVYSFIPCFNLNKNKTIHSPSKATTEHDKLMLESRTQMLTT